ncbi:MAG TPA: acetyl-CoA C-acetyltransferase, partial [Burkholderiaceae bacterium]
LQEGGRITAAVSSQIADGAAALLVASEQAVSDHGLEPRARIHHLSVRGADPERLNVHGGAIALGHPLGASGTKLMTTLVHALHRQGKRYGLQTMCEGGGMANVTIVERL